MADDVSPYTQIIGEPLDGTPRKNVINVEPPCGPKALKKLCSGKPFTSSSNVLAPVKTGIGSTTFQLCASSQFQFNSAAPFVLVGRPPTPPNFFLFRCGDKNFAWDFQAVVEACVDNSQNDSDWTLGFIQTARSFNVVASYANGWKATRTIGSQPARDCEPETCPAPWFNPNQPGVISRPVGLDEGKAAEILDNPNFKLPLYLPEDPKIQPCAGLERVDFDAIFDVFLVAQFNGTGASTPPPLIFIANVTVTVSQSAKREMSLTPDDVNAWPTANLTSNPTHRLGVISGGQGPQTPVLDQPVANPLIRKLNITQGQPCPNK
jgi:hypothetical protein